MADTATSLRTGSWHGDRALPIPFPDDWEVTTHWPATPPPLGDDALRAALERPTGQPPLRELARGARAPVIVVDDLTRPTPVARVLPLLLAHLAEAGAAAPTVIVATGMHAPPRPADVARKLGPAAEGLRVVVHDPRRDLVRMGRTARGTPVLCNGAVARSDLVIGVGGVYPQNTAGFGGGAKLALGVLGRRSIVHLHYGRAGAARPYDTSNEFRRDLDEIARITRFATMLTLHVDAERAIVRVAAGDYRAYYEDAVRFARETYAVPLPGDADVVVVNAYPMDNSLTMARAKGGIPFRHALPGASRVLVAACDEGLGHHGLFPYARLPVGEALRQKWRRFSVRPPRALLAGALRRLRPEARPTPPAPAPRSRIPWLWRGGVTAPPLPAVLPGLHEASWDEIVAGIRREQGDRPLRVALYPCAPLLCFPST